jgi:phosphatidylserine decarboxylase
MSPAFQNIAPQRTLTAIAHLMANCEIPWIKNYLIRYFVNKYPVRLEDAIEENPYQYTSFNHFFTRALKPHVRPLTTDPLVIVSPVDGYISQYGHIHQGTLLQAKGFNYTVQALLGGDPSIAEAFSEGEFLTAYLAPKDYHRVHMPTDGTLCQMTYIPGKLFSVNPRTASAIPNLFARNERVLCLFNTPHGRMAVILVGAMIVGSIETVWAGTIAPPHLNRSGIKTWHYPETEHDSAIHLEKGAELGRFKLGSTVIILFEKNKMIWNPTLEPTEDLLMGQPLGIFQ